MIGVIDYGMGNLFSVSKALERLNIEYKIGDRPDQLHGCDGYILPGVGAFPDAMKALAEHQFIGFIHQKVDEGVPLYGICLGMQLLFEGSEEGGQTDGLGLFTGTIRRFFRNGSKRPGLQSPAYGVESDEYPSSGKRTADRRGE